MSIRSSIMLTLMFGWSLGIIGSGLVLLGVIFNGTAGLEDFVVSAITTGVIPVTATQILLVLIRSLLPKNFFVYVLGNGFFTAGFVAVISAFLSTWLLIMSGTYTFAYLQQTLLPYFPLMFMPEAVLNGAIITVLVSFFPAWVGSFSDELYLKGK